jgi:hypothetical protein
MKKRRISENLSASLFNKDFSNDPSHRKVPLRYTNSLPGKGQKNRISQETDPQKIYQDGCFYNN